MPWWSTVLFSAAITVVCTRGSIFEPLRSRGPEIWRDFSGCPLCVGVWIGGAAWAVEHLGWTFRQVFAVLGTGCVTGVLALSVALLHDFLGSHATLADGRADREGKDK